MNKIIILLCFTITSVFSQAVIIEPNGGIELNSENQAIQFPNNGTSNKSMFYIFKNGSTNPYKMVFSHSPAYPTWGLQYQDVGDAFVFRNSATDVLKVGLSPENVTINSPAVLNNSLNVVGATSVNTLAISSGGSTNDFLIKSNSGGDVGFKKGNNRLGINFIIALSGTFPSRSSIDEGDKTISGADPLLGEISMFAGNFAPRGWAFCDGQILLISQYSALFSLLGTTYGGNGSTTFALPDLRAAAPVHKGTATNGLSWSLGEKN